MVSFTNPFIEELFAHYDEPYQSKLLELRELIYTIAARLDGVGELTEELKWGQPTYSTLATKSGTPIRIDKFGHQNVAIFFNCHTVLVERFREIFHDELVFSKNRAIVLDPLRTLPIEQLTFCLTCALTYHKDKIKQNGS